MDDFSVITPVSDEIYNIIQNIKKREWICSVHDIDDDLRYNPGAYVTNSEIDKIKYIIFFDRNIFSFILSAFKKSKIKQVHRDAIGLLVFCRISDIFCDVSIPVYEKTNCQSELLEEVIEEVKIFWRIDDNEVGYDMMIEFANSKRNDFLINMEKDLTHSINKIKNWFDEYQKLKEWDSIYLIMLKIVDIKFFLKKDGNEGFRLLIEWIYVEFRKSLVCIIFAMFIFGEIKLKRIMKYKENDESSIRKKQVENMTWDLYYMNLYLRRMQTKTENEEYLIATDDKVIKKIFKSVIEIQNNMSVEIMKRYIDKKNYEMIDFLEEIESSNLERALSGGKFKNPKHRENLIKEYEEKIFGI